MVELHPTLGLHDDELALTSYLHFMVYHQIRGRPLPSIGFKRALITEASLVVFIIILPLSVLWLPFPAYGINGALCWTMHVHEDCSENTLGSRFELIYTYSCVIVRLVAFRGVLPTCVVV